MLQKVVQASTFTVSCPIELVNSLQMITSGLHLSPTQMREVVTGANHTGTLSDCIGCALFPLASSSVGAATVLAS